MNRSFLVSRCVPLPAIHVAPFLSKTGPLARCRSTAPHALLVSRSLPPRAAPCLHVALAPSGVCIVSCRAVTIERLPSSELMLINDNQWRRLFIEIMQRPCEHGVTGSNRDDDIPSYLEWALDETVLQYCPKERRMHVADESNQVCLRTSNDKTQLTATPCVNKTGEVVGMQIIARGKTARSHADIPPGGLLLDAAYQNHCKKPV